ncbi:MAG: hypothetical protein ACR2G5_14950 [Pyrinomonadaceae bacterium]
MNPIDRIKEILDTYQKYGWKIERVLMRPETREVVIQEQISFAEARIEEGSIDALWFSRASHNNRQAWELRLVAESNYALFETFEADEFEEQREEVRCEMEGRMGEYVNRAPGEVMSKEC